MARNSTRPARTASNSFETRPSLPPNLKAERLAAFENGAWPSKEEYEALYRKIRDTAGCDWYTHKAHHNFRSRQRKETRARASALAMPREADVPRTPAPNHDHSAGTRTMEVHGSALRRDSDVPRTAAPNDDHAAIIPTAEAPPPPSPAFDDIMLALKGCSPAVHGEILAAQNPTAAQFRHWACSSTVPAVAVFLLWEALHPFI